MLPNWTQHSRQVNMMFGNEENLNAHSERQVNLTFGSKGLINLTLYMIYDSYVCS
jgi:hypothetical protein